MAETATDSRECVHSGVFPQHIQAQSVEAEQEIIRGAKLGLGNIRLRSVKMRAVRALSMRSVRRSNQVHASDKTASRRKPLGINGEASGGRPDLSFPARVLGQRRIDTLVQAWRLCGFVDSLYVLWMVPFRLGFLFDPWATADSASSWTAELSVLTALDVAGCLVRSCLLHRELRRASQRVGLILLALLLRLSCYKLPALVRLHATLSTELRPRSRSSVRMSASQTQPPQPEAFSLIHREGTQLRRGGSAKNTVQPRMSVASAPSNILRSPNRESRRRTTSPWLSSLSLAANCVPWEVVVALAGYNYSCLHVVGVARFLQAYGNARTQFSSVVMPTFARWRLMQMLSFSTVSITAHLFVLGIYLSHVAACGYMLVAHIECGGSFARCRKEPFPEAWVLRDNLERASNLRKYARTLYWACKTVVTLGQGDLIPVTLVETAYRVCIQFASGLWATAIVTAYGFFFTHKDADMPTKISTQLIQAKKFMRAREMSPQLLTSVSAYFYYMERTRNGVEEALILSNLPPHYRSQCSNYVRFKCFGQIPIFRNRQGAFLRTILGLLESDFFTPDQTVLAVGDKEEMLILASGSVRIVDEQGGGLLIGRLTAGTSYAEYALFEDYVAQNHLIADGFCELWRLPRQAFELAVHKHFTSASGANAGQKNRAGSSSEVASRVFNSLSSMQDNARMVKLAGKGSALMKAFSRKGSGTPLLKRDQSAIVTWRHVGSRFRRAWVRVECVLLFWLLWEVPYHVAFQRGFGLLNDYRVQPNMGAISAKLQKLDFACALLVELFFLADLALRALVFVHPTAADVVELQPAGSSDATSTAAAVATPTSLVPSGRDRLARSLREKRAAFQRFLKHEPGSWLDMAANLPISLVWDVLPKNHFSHRAIQVVRFARLARLLRARHLRRKLKAIMMELGFAPAQRMLVYIIVLCVTVANLAGCLFFLAGDGTDFHGGLPPEGVPLDSISWQSCLEAASLADNCSWYMFDRSTFDIDAPYLRSLHWSIVLLSTVGYGDIVAFSTVECAVGCVWIFLGANICYLTSSALSSVLDQFNIVSLLKDGHAEELNVALAGMPAVSDTTKQAVRNFFEMKWKLNGSTMRSDEFAHRLPRSLRREVYESLYLDDFRRCALFADDAELDEFVRALTLVTTSEIFLKQIVVAREGHLATEFFLIQSGECECLLPAVRAPPTESSASLAAVDGSTLRWSMLGSTLATSSLKAAAATVTASSSFWSKLKRNKGMARLLKSAPEQREAAMQRLRKPSLLPKKATRATFAAPAPAVPDFVRMLRNQKKENSLFKSAANIFRARSDSSAIRRGASAPAGKPISRRSAVADPEEKPDPLRVPLRLSGVQAALSLAASPPRPAITSIVPLAASTRKLASSLGSLSTSPPAALPPPLLTKPSLLRRDTLRNVASLSASSRSVKPVPVLMLKPSDYFGEESLLRTPELYDVTVRVVSSAAQVAVVRREDYLAVAARFPKQAAKVKARNQTQRVLDRRLLHTHRTNFVAKPKITKFFFSGAHRASAADAEDPSATASAGRGDGLLAFVVDPEARVATWWRRAVRVVLVYNFFAISFRIAFLPRPAPTTMAALTAVDCLADLVFLLDVFLKYGRMGYVELGEKIMDPTAIRRRYRESWLWADCVSLLPPLFVTRSYWLTTLTRAPRLVRSVHLAGVTRDTHTYIQEHYLKGNTLFSSLFDLAKFFLIFLSTAHYASCAYYLLGRLQLESGLVQRSWVSMDPILLQHPRSPTVHYMRAFYWCLSTFTVDCFGDVWSRNALETLFAMFTCALGWIFIGQVIGRINSLMITLDKERKQRNDRVEHLQQYAKQRRLPEALRLRALEGLHYKSECAVALRLRDTLRELPTALRAGLFYELYGPALHSVPELLGALAPVHLEALSAALYLEIYLHGDVIYEAGRRGNRLFLLQHGVAEVFSALSGTTYARLEAGSAHAAGVMFGEFAFFLRGARRLASTRAVRSCQVLQLEYATWARLWPRATRAAIERVLLPAVQRKHRAEARAFLNIDKNLFVRSAAPLPPLTADGLDVASVLARERKAARPWGPQPPPSPPPRRRLSAFSPPPPATHAPPSVAPIRLRRGSVGADPSTALTIGGGSHPAAAAAAVAAPTSAGDRARATSLSAPRTQASFSRRMSTMSMQLPGALRLPSERLQLPTATRQDEASSSPVSVGRMGSLRRLFPSILGSSARPPADGSGDGSGSGSGAPPASSSPKAGQDALAIAAPAPEPLPLRRSFAVSSVLVEIQWKRHEKRLRALQLFAVSWAQIERNAQLTLPKRMERRRSVTIARGLAGARRPRGPGGAARVASADDGRVSSASTLPVAAEVVAAARRGPRRHSLLVVRADLDRKFALAESAVPLLSARIAAHLRLEARASSSARRGSLAGSVGGSRATAGRRASSIATDEDFGFSDATDLEDADGGPRDDCGALKWALGLLVRLLRLLRPLRALAPGLSASTKVAPAPSAAAARVATFSGSALPVSAPRASLVIAPPPPPTGYSSAAPASRGPFDVNSRFRRAWTAVMLAATLYHISISPYRVSFMDGFLNDPEAEALVIAWLALETALVDSLLVADFVLRLRFFAFSDGGETVTDAQAIAARYRREGSFLLDLLALAPFELLLLAAAPLLGEPPARRSPDQWPLFHSPSGGLVNWHTVAFLKLNRFLRVAHVHALSDELQRALLYESKALAWLQLRPGVLYLVRLGLDFLLGTHWLACIFFGVSYLNFENGDVSWLTTPGMLTPAGCADLDAVRRVPVSEAYLRSFHFSIGAITTVCYGDILPMNAVENAATLAVILVSVVLFSVLSGGFFKYFAMELGARAEFEERVAHVGHFMAFHDFPADMWTQMKVYFALSWQESKGLHEEQQLRGLPTALRQDVARHVHANLIAHVRLFHDCDESFSRAVIAAIKHEFFVRNDVIIQRGDMERSLYIVETGLVIISAVRKKKPARRPDARLDPGECERDGLDARPTAEREHSHGDDSVNEWLALSRQPAAARRPPRAEASIVGVVARPDATTTPPDINMSTEREERIVKGPFDYFGERSLLFGTPRNATCVAACVSSLFVLTSDRFDAILEEFPSYRSKVVHAWVMTRPPPPTADKEADAHAAH